MAHLSEWLGAIVAAVCGLHAVVTKRVTFGDDLQVWLYGWRAVAIGCATLLIAALLAAMALGLVSADLG